MPEFALTGGQMYAADALMMEAGVPGKMLMLNAARAVADEVTALEPSRAMIFCGACNNAGDGYACAWLLGMHGGTEVTVVELSTAKRLPEDAQMHRDIAGNCPNVKLLSAQSHEDIFDIINGFPDDGVIVDAIFGIGLSRAPGGVFRAAIEAINGSKARVVSVDVPSGIDGTSGQAPGVAVMADVTVTFQHMKTGHIFLPGGTNCGRLKVRKIGFYTAEERYAQVLGEEDIARMLPKRKRDAHKGDFGKGLLIAGSERMMGAAILSARAALRSGVGLLTLAVPEGCANAARISVPEAMLAPVCEGEGLIAAVSEAIQGKTAAAVGPGLGTGKGVTDIVRHIIEETSLPIVLDADALNALGRTGRLSKNVVVTPHPGEMARLSGLPVDHIVKAPMEVAQKFAYEWGCTVLLKGAVSVIAAYDGRVTLNTVGNPGLAKGGSGDLLTGVILALLCQGLSPYDAACCGAFILGKAADHALKTTGERAMIASDVIEALKHVSCGHCES